MNSAFVASHRRVLLAASCMAAGSQVPEQRPVVCVDRLAIELKARLGRDLAAGRIKTMRMIPSRCSWLTVRFFVHSHIPPDPPTTLPPSHPSHALPASPLRSRRSVHPPQSPPPPNHQPPNPPVPTNTHPTGHSARLAPEAPTPDTSLHHVHHPKTQPQLPHSIRQHLCKAAHLT